MSGQAGEKERIELVTAAAVADVLGAKLVRRDVPGAQQMRDFDLVFSAGRADEPLEVTTFASQPEIQTRQRLDRIDEEVVAPELSNDWYLDVGGPILSQRTRTLDVRQLAKEIVARLAVLEAGGYRSIEHVTMDHDPAVAAEMRRLRTLGVSGGHGRPHAEGEDPRVVFVASVGGFVHADLVAGGIEREAGKSDNQKKLSEPAEALCRHVVVIFDPSSGPAFTAARQGCGGRLPELPQSITTAWALASGVLLWTRPPDAWERHRIPDGSLNRQRLGYALDHASHAATGSSYARSPRDSMSTGGYRSTSPERVAFERASYGHSAASTSTSYTASWPCGLRSRRSTPPRSRTTLRGYS
jgi:hypothetical protein